jgi:cytochrome b involved in lipid metabolism
MKANVLAGIAVSSVLAIGGIVFIISGNDSSDSSLNSTAEVSQSTSESTASQSDSTKPEPVAETQNSSKITKADVATHNSESDCWTIIDGSVYDITSYIPRHPGGDNILSACGTDGTALFNGEKPGQNGGTNDHGSSAKSQLARLKVGDLSQ